MSETPEAARKPTPTLLMKVDEVARTLGVCERVVRSLGKRGAIQTCRIGRAIRYVRDDVERFAATGGGQ